MDLLRLLSVVRKELRQLFRDRDSLRLFLIAPIMQLLLFSFAVTTDLKGITLGVVMEDPSPAARGLVRSIQATHAFNLTQESARPDDPRRWPDRGEAQIVLHIPPDFSRSLSRGETPAVQVLSDGSDANTATRAFQYLNGAALTWANRDRRDRMALHPERGVRFVRAPRITLEPRFWYNPDLKSRNFMIPGVLALILLMLALVQTSLMVVKERELGTLEQLSVTPIQGAELLIGKTIPTAGATLLVATTTLALARFAFNVPLRGSLLFLVFSGCLFLLSSTGMGLLVSVVSRSQIQAQLTAGFVAQPMVLLSGFMFPIANMPPWAQALTYVMPPRYFLEITRGVFLKGQGFAELWPQAGMLALLGSCLYGAGVLLFRKRVD